MSQHSGIPPLTIQRLPLYLRCLIRLQSQRVDVVSSERIAELAGTNAAQVRKDFSYLGEFGVRGLGYEVDSLVVHLSRWLGLQRTRNVAIIGYGRLGAALQGYGGLQDRGFLVRAVFDIDADKVGMSVPGGITVESMNRFAEVAKENDIELAIVTVPASAAQGIAEKVVAAGVKGILNFAPQRLELPHDVAVRQADLAAELQILSYHLREDFGS
ncbi:MAG: redox-sensing transcriptional repressor Rex [Actinobacteria bacterium]|nr:redox-sensing transcriptional repressor Rex [Actinomycetota bacterium]